MFHSLLYKVPSSSYFSNHTHYVFFMDIINQSSYHMGFQPDFRFFVLWNGLSTYAILQHLIKRWWEYRFPLNANWLSVLCLMWKGQVINVKCDKRNFENSYFWRLHKILNGHFTMRCYTTTRCNAVQGLSAYIIAVCGRAEPFVIEFVAPRPGTRFIERWRHGATHPHPPGPQPTIDLIPTS